jgi:hypothetical protein
MARPAQEGTVASRDRRRASSRISLLLWREGRRAYAWQRKYLDAICSTTARCMRPANAHCVKLSV